MQKDQMGLLKANINTVNAQTTLSGRNHKLMKDKSSINQSTLEFNSSKLNLIAHVNKRQ